MPLGQLTDHGLYTLDEFMFMSKVQMLDALGNASGTGGDG